MFLMSKKGYHKLKEKLKEVKDKIYRGVTCDFFNAYSDAVKL